MYESYKKNAPDGCYWFFRFQAISSNPSNVPEVLRDNIIKQLLS